MFPWRNHGDKAPAARLRQQLRPQLPYLAHQSFRLNRQTRGEHENRPETRLPFAPLQKRNRRRMQPRPLRQHFVREPLLLPKPEKDMSECFGSIQATSVKILTPK
jgi:hypothetical protein